MIVVFLRDESGATAVEYAMMASMFALIVLTTLGLLSTAIQNSYTHTATSMQGAMGS